MLEELVCWGIALGLMFSKVEGFTSDYTRITFAMGFIILGSIYKAIEVYRTTHMIDIDVDTDENGNIVVSKTK